MITATMRGIWRDVKQPVPVEVSGDLRYLSLVSIQQAEQDVAVHNYERLLRCHCANDYDNRAWHILHSSAGTFVTAITKAGGGGCVDIRNPSRNYDNTFIVYELLQHIQ